MRRPACIALLIGATALVGCGVEDTAPKAAPGSPENPLVAAPGDVNEGQPKPADAPGYDTLLDRQASTSERRFTPCNLVTRSQARAILGGRVRAPVEAPQGPTCIYRAEAGGPFVTLAVQSLDLDIVKKRVRRREAVEVADRSAYCGMYGTPVLYVPLRDQRVLSVAAPCSVAKRFAARALARLGG
jgi:hypothetical protein